MTNHFPSLMQEYIYLSRYARWLPEKNRREFWPETVDRYFNFFDKHLKENHKFKFDKEIRKELREAVYTLKAMPSMRCIMTAGEALERENIAGYNCLASETMVLTKEYGVVPIHSLEGKTCNVWTSRKEWAPAEFKSYGKQKLYKLVVGYNKYSREIYATADHRWIIDGRDVLTKHLEPGQEIPFNPVNRKVDTDSIDYRLGVIHGLVYGDGTAVYKTVAAQRRLKGYHIRLCSDAEDLLPYFKEYPMSHPNTFDGDPIIYLYDDFAKTHDLKNLPNSDETDDYMIGFFRGWLAADGYVSKTGQVSLCLGPDEETWVRQYMPRVGYHFSSSYKLASKTNYGERNKESRILQLLRPSLQTEDFIIERKRNKFSSFGYSLVVRSVDITDRYEKVFCAEVPSTHDFTLDNGVLTGNCSYVAVDSFRAFDEILYILMNGTGVGYSVESKFVNQLPLVAEEFHDTDTTIVVADSKLGWAKSLKELIGLLSAGQVPQWDISKVRPAGSPLKTFGGRASGPEPLINLFKFVTEVFKNAAGRRLTTLECHDIVCMIADIVVVGGVRRSALISLSDLEDDLMQKAKSIYKVTLVFQQGDEIAFDYVTPSGETKHFVWKFNPNNLNDMYNVRMIANERKVGWWIVAVYRALANNSFVAEDEKVDAGTFLKEWHSLYDSKSGERGIFSRAASKKKTLESGRRLADFDFGTNPCSEIILRSLEFCNLSEVVVRADDTIETLRQKVRWATILGTLQSTLTNFKYIRKKWKENCEDERLLGVSLTGILDNPYTNGKKGKLKELLEELKEVAVETNKEWADKIGISYSRAITCVKPSGTVSQLVDSASGIHARHSPYYVRTVRADKKDPLAKLMVDLGFPYEDDLGKPNDMYVFSFPVKAPETAVFRNDMTAIEQLELWLTYYRHWCEHKPSITITIKEDEWLDVGAWVFKHFDEMAGVSFLPYDGGEYQQAPYQEIDATTYEQWLQKMPTDVDWKLLEHYETTDQTIGSQELACSAAGGCELK